MNGILHCWIVGVLFVNSVCEAADRCYSPTTLLEGKRRIVGVVLRANSEQSNYLASEVRYDDDGWCSAELGGDIFYPYLEVYPLDQERITSLKSYTQLLTYPIYGQTFRLIPYKWNNYDYACTKLEIVGCPSSECKVERNLGEDDGVVVTMDGSVVRHEDLFDFDDGQSFCLPSGEDHPNITITFPSVVLIMEFGIHGFDNTFPFSDAFVTSYTLSYLQDGHFVDYVNDLGTTVFTVSDVDKHFYGLWPPIKTSMLKFIANKWSSRPCLNLLVEGCSGSDVVEHLINPTAGLVDNTVETVTMTKTIFMTMSSTAIPSPTSTSTHIDLSNQTSTHTSLSTQTSVQTSLLTHTPTQTSHHSCDSDDDDDDTAIFVSIAVVVVGILVTTIIVVVGVILCRHDRRNKNDMGSTDPLIPTKNYGSVIHTTSVGAENDLYGRPEFQTAENDDDDDDVYEELPQDNNGLDNKAYGSSMPRNGQSVNDNDDDYDVIYSQPRP
ncbi:uncharacterized protein [Dysidea avara]|uniref:uncharacterized protein isoform X2 n=1 Tax=Dysidea avara TaxID=196820 RepID=UPI0033332AF7